MNSSGGRPYRALIGRPGPIRVLTVLALAASAAGCSAGAAQAPRAAARPRPSGVTSELAPYQLSAPLSREVVVASGSHLRILGGLDAAQQTVGGVFDLDPASGALAPVGQLARPVHDAAGAVLGGSDLVFGGGSPATVSTTQAFRPGTGSAALGSLPRPRSDLEAVVVNRRIFLIGGYDGSRTDPAVLATTDGRTFHQVAALPVPVRYPAVAVVDSRIYVLGGSDASGTADSRAIQEIDPATGRAVVVGHLPHPLGHSAAATIGGEVYVAGGEVNGAATSQIERFDPATNRVTAAGQLPEAVSDAGVATLDGVTYLIGGETAGKALSSVVELRTAPDPRTAGAGPDPFTGRLLIADRGNNRLLLVDASQRVLWTFPSASAPAPVGGFYFPDDAFFAARGTEIISNEEDNNAIVRIAFPSGRILWSYGHARVAGSAPGYLNQPDDAYLLRDGTVAVADATNCRILFISPAGSPSGQIGTTGSCVHRPPASLGYPNGDTPLPNGDVLISEVHGSWISEYTPQGRLVWTLQLPIGYPSDPQQLGPDLYLVADYSRPGGIYEFDREGHITWSYRVPSGPGMLDHPSLAERLPDGLIAVNDDYRDRVVMIDPRTDRIVWQYGVTDGPGTAPGLLNTPDGFDLLAPDGTTPTHPQTR